MTNKSALLELASRCEKATGPDRELDLAIALAVGDETWAEPDRAKLYYTASLDAAMSLYLRVPERIPSDPRKATAEALRQRAEELA
jgi:hypothetical protein